MIPLSEEFYLGRDETRMKDPRDAERQTRTAEVLLERFFDADPEKRWELQLVADEVGMGKTFVALAVAFSVIAAARERTAGDLVGCAPRVLVIAPQASLARKWIREVGEFVNRCVPEVRREEIGRWFRSSTFLERPDDIAAHLRASDGPSMLVTHMGALGEGKKLKHYDLKRRVLLGVVFRFWGARFQRDARERLLKGAPAEWPTQPDALTQVSKEEWARTPFRGDDDMVAALRAYATSGGADELEALLDTCKAIAEPYVRNRDELFGKVENHLNRIYRGVCFAGIDQPLPLVIVDEAHNWKNGPSQKTNGYGGFARSLASLARRVLLLTATPFQLRPDEMIELLRIGGIITPSADPQEVAIRRARMDDHREKVIKPVLETAARQSRALAKAWARLPARAAAQLPELWEAPSLDRIRQELRAIAHEPGRVSPDAVARIVDGAVVGQPPELRDILREALRLYAFNEDLSQELGAFVIRHRRRTDHRVFRIGHEYAANDDRVMARSDRIALHAAAGIDVRGDAELPHYLLMRCVSESKNGKGRSSLGTALTGCYSTLFESAEGRNLKQKLSAGRGAAYFQLLEGMVGEKRDPEHPKVKVVVDAAMDTWRAGEKMLIFCFRTHTAKRLRAILHDRIERELNQRSREVLNGEKALQNLRSRISRREGNLAPLALDRVFWSLRWAARSESVPLPDIAAEDLRLTDGELDELARLALRYDVDLQDETPDRVFIHRCVEHLVAKRLVQAGARGRLFSEFLRAMSDEAWVRAPYGVLDAGEDDGEEDDDEAPHRDVAKVDDRGVHAIYYTRNPDPSWEQVAPLAADLRDRRQRALKTNQIPIIDTYAYAPSFWFGDRPEEVFEGDAGAHAARTLAAMHRHLLTITRKGADFDWRQRMLVFQALRRALMRESLLVRILPARADLEEQSWGDLLVQRLFAPLEGQRESMADRLSVFLEDLKAADGAVYEPGTTRHAMYEATRMRDTQFVVLVDGSTEQDRRERVFAGFNSPLLPEILICTSVGQEGIDLHRHCRRVVHYDLAWNPAVLEQRTGRVDRIGSKTFRERQAGAEGGSAHLDVGVPFLAGTYDERMYEELRVRAQTFEVLTGGDVAADNLEGSDGEEGAEGTEEGLGFAVLPPKMIEALRVRLHVWEAP